MPGHTYSLKKTTRTKTYRATLRAKDKEDAVKKFMAINGLKSIEGVYVQYLR